MVDLDEALDILGLDRTADRATVRRHYRAGLKAAHPDRGGDPTSVRRIVAAYEVIVSAFGSGTALTRADDGPPEHESSMTPAGDDGLVLEIPGQEVFYRLHAAFDEVGSVTYADPAAGLLEAILDATPGVGAGQLTASVIARDGQTQVLFTLESLDGGTASPIEEIVRRVAALVAHQGEGTQGETTSPG